MKGRAFNFFQLSHSQVGQEWGVGSLLEPWRQLRAPGQGSAGAAGLGGREGAEVRWEGCQEPLCLGLWDSGCTRSWRVAQLCQPRFATSFVLATASWSGWIWGSSV